MRRQNVIRNCLTNDAEKQGANNTNVIQVQMLQLKSQEIKIIFTLKKKKSTITKKE